MGARKTPMTQEERDIAAQRCRKRNAARHAAKKHNPAGRPAKAEPRILGQVLPWRERIQWVLDHLRLQRLEEVPDEATLALWEHARKDRQSFMDKYVPMLARAEQGEADKWNQQEDDPGGDLARKHAEDWIERWRAKMERHEGQLKLSVQGAQYWIGPDEARRLQEEIGRELARSAG
jgi:hypothetical protein